MAELGWGRGRGEAGQGKKDKTLFVVFLCILNSGNASKDQISYGLVIFVLPVVVFQSTKYLASSSSQAIPDFERSWVDK